jgi:phosphoribosylanthranilate isomerase
MVARVKICGLTRPDDVESAVKHGAGFLGFILECPSKRRLSVTEAAAIAMPAKDIVARVAVTVNPSDDLIDRILSQMQPDYIQLHGDETPSRAADIAKRIPILKAVGIASDDDMKSSETYAGIADFLLYDAKPPKGETVRGGHGVAIDWSIIKRAPTPKTFAVAGGLTPDNVARAITATRAPIVDVSSGVEASPGVKDTSKINAFMDAVRNG